MNKPRILVMTAAGKTGMPVALQLLSEGFPLTALVRREDHRSEYLRSKGADIVVGSITDPGEMQRAMAGVQRAYFCVPLGPGTLKAAAVFMTVATQAESKLESLVVMSQWLANPYHPSVHTREAWLADRLFALLPITAVTTISVGFFADNDMQSLEFAAQFGQLVLPYGSGLNAPPSNEDIARVIAEILARPEGHAGKSYRPTGPELLSANDMATILTKVLGHNVKYVEAPNWLMSKMMKGMGFSDFSIAQIQQYTLDYQKGAFALNAPTEVVRRITGREPENFETIARRYVSAKPDMKRNPVSQLKLMVLTFVTAISQWPQLKRYLAGGDFSDRKRLSLSADSAEWRASHASGQPRPTDPIPAQAGLSY